MLHKFSAFSGRQSRVDRGDETVIVFAVTAQYLLREFVGFQSSLRSDLRQLRFFSGCNEISMVRV
jgi:hypothetical protein